MLARRVGQLFERDLVLGKPLRIRIARIEALLDLLIGDDPARHRIDQKHLAGLQAALLFHVLRLHRQHARFRRHHDQVIVGNQVARRPQPIAVKRRADHPAIREGNGGRTIPRLHQRGVIFVERPLPRVHVRIAGPCLGDQHGHGVR